MSRSLDIETLVEDSFVGLLSGVLSAELSGVAIKHWDDNENADLTPMVKVSALLTEELEGTVNLYTASDIIVDFGVFTSKRRDLNGREANSIRGDIRDLINQDNIVTLMNATSGLLVYNNGVIPQTSFQTDDKKLFQKGISVRVVATTIE